MQGLLSPVRRKNIKQIAEAAGDRKPDDSETEKALYESRTYPSAHTIHTRIRSAAARAAAGGGADVL
jgi:hypothetical protein